MTGIVVGLLFLIIIVGVLVLKNPRYSNNNTSPIVMADRKDDK